MLARRQAGQVGAGSTPQIKQTPYKTLRKLYLGWGRVDALLGGLWPMANGMWARTFYLCAHAKENGPRIQFNYLARRPAARFRAKGRL